MKHSKIWTPLVLGTCLIAAVSCGSDDDDSGSGAQQEEAPQAQTDVGTYNVTFSPVNAGVAGNAAAGTGTITVDEQSIAVQLDMTGVPARITHLQNIGSGSACPGAGADANGDGFVDVVEGVPSYGQILIPLDANLNSQASGANVGGRADSSGAYRYSRRAQYSRLLEDLQREDTNTSDAVTKLPQGTTLLGLEGRTVIIHGVPESANLPDTVAGLPGSNASAERVIPIACGVITRAADGGTTGGTGTGTTTGETGTTTGETGTTTGETGTTTGETGTITGGETGTTTGTTGTTTTGGTTGV